MTELQVQDVGKGDAQAERSETTATNLKLALLRLYAGEQGVEFPDRSLNVRADNDSPNPEMLRGFDVSHEVVEKNGLICAGAQQFEGVVVDRGVRFAHPDFARIHDRVEHVVDGQ